VVESYGVYIKLGVHKNQNVVSVHVSGMLNQIWMTFATYLVSIVIALLMTTEQKWLALQRMLN